MVGFGLGSVDLKGCILISSFAVPPNKIMARWAGLATEIRARAGGGLGGLRKLGLSWFSFGGPRKLGLGLLGWIVLTIYLSRCFNKRDKLLRNLFQGWSTLKSYSNVTNKKRLWKVFAFPFTLIFALDLRDVLAELIACTFIFIQFKMLFLILGGGKKEFFFLFFFFFLQKYIVI